MKNYSLAGCPNCCLCFVTCSVVLNFVGGAYKVYQYTVPSITSQNVALGG